MKELVHFLAQQLVNNPEAVEVKETQGDTASVLELRVAKEDLGPRFGHSCPRSTRFYRVERQVPGVSAARLQANKSQHDTNCARRSRWPGSGGRAQGGGRNDRYERPSTCPPW